LFGQNKQKNKNKKLKKTVFCQKQNKTKKKKQQKAVSPSKSRKNHEQEMKIALYIQIQYIHLKRAEKVFYPILVKIRSNHILHAIWLVLLYLFIISYRLPSVLFLVAVIFSPFFFLVGFLVQNFRSFMQGHLGKGWRDPTKKNQNGGRQKRWRGWSWLDKACHNISFGGGLFAERGNEGEEKRKRIFLVNRKGKKRRKREKEKKGKKRK